jgi:hypothetical protein
MLSMDEPENWHWTDAPWRAKLGDMYSTTIQPAGELVAGVRLYYDLPAER